MKNDLIMLQIKPFLHDLFSLFLIVLKCLFLYNIEVNMLVQPLILLCRISPILTSNKVLTEASVCV